MFIYATVYIYLDKYISLKKREKRGTCSVMALISLIIGKVCVFFVSG